MTTISEGATAASGELVLSGEADAYGHRKLGGIGQLLGAALKERTGEDVVYQQLAYLMRSGSPDSLDLMVATNYAVMAADLAIEGDTAAWSRSGTAATRRSRSPRRARASSASTSTSCTTSASTARRSATSSASRCSSIDARTPLAVVPHEARRDVGEPPGIHTSTGSSTGAAILGVLTGGGLSARGDSRRRPRSSPPATVVGIRRGWQGLAERETAPLDRNAVSGILPARRDDPRLLGLEPVPRGGRSRGGEGRDRELGLDGVVAIGGEGTLGIAHRLHGELGYPVVGVPKTIDNDLAGTDVTIGFDTAVHVCTEAIDRLHTTAESHDRVMVVEVMGRNTGWIALAAACRAAPT